MTFLKKYLVLFILLSLSLPVLQCSPSSQQINPDTLSQIPKYSNTVYFDWSKLPKDEKAEYYAWSEKYLYYFLSLKIIPEKEGEVPSREVTRAEFIDWLVKIKKIAYMKTDYVFSDIDKKHPHFKAVETALEAKIIDRDPHFRPDAPLLRQEAAVWLVRAKGEEAIKLASSISEPLIAAQDGYFEIPKDYVGFLTVCYQPEHQLLHYRWTAGDDFRYIKPNAPMILAEAAHSLIMLAYPPKRGGTITIGMSSEPKSLFSGLEQSAALTHITSLLYTDAIGGRDENWCWFPIFIKRIPTRENGLFVVKDDGRMEITFEMRKGLKWADGVEITAKDAVFSFYFTNHPAFPTIHSEVDFWIEKVEALDDYTIRYHWSQPYTFANYSLGFFPAHYFEKNFQYTLQPYSLNDPRYYDPSKDNLATQEKDESFKSAQYLKDEEFILKASQGEYNTAPLHAGPYKVKKWERGQSLILEPNENHIFGKPLLDSFIFRTIENTDTLLAATLAGNVDMTLSGLSLDQVMQLENNKETTQISYIVPSMTWDHIDLNIDDPVFSDRKVRQALLHAIDRPGISEELYFGKNPVANAWLPPKHPAYNEDLITKYEYDPKKAKQLLVEAGWILNEKTGLFEKDGKPLKITFITSAGNKLREQMQAVIVSNWKDIGIDAEVKNEQSTTLFTDTLNGRKFHGPTAIMFAWVMGPESNLYSTANSTQIPTQSNGWSGQNYTGFRDERVDLLTEDNLKQLDKKKIYRNLEEIQTTLTRELPSLPLFYRVDVTTAHKNLRGYFPSGSGTSATWNGQFWSWDQ